MTPHLLLYPFTLSLPRSSEPPSRAFVTLQLFLKNKSTTELSQFYAKYNQASTALGLAGVVSYVCDTVVQPPEGVYP